MVKEYCLSLVRHAADDNKGAFMQSTAFSGLSFGGMETKMRIKNLLSHKISSREIQIASICVTLVFSLLVSASSIDHQPWVREKPAEPEESAVIASETTESEPSETTAETDTASISRISRAAPFPLRAAISPRAAERASSRAVISCITAYHLHSLKKINGEFL